MTRIFASKPFTIAGGAPWPGLARLPRFALMLLIGAAATTAAAQAQNDAADPAPEQAPQEASPAESEAADPGDAASAGEALEEDRAAQAYASKCMGCHTIGGGALSGPDLKPSTAWPRQNLWDAIKRMETNVGPMPDEEVDLYTDFLLSPNPAERLENARKQAALRDAASMEPASAEKGEALFFGRQAFRNGGISCGACHQAGGRGGNLATSLEDAYTRIGEAPLISTCERPGYPVMRAMYEDHPITKQEAVHVVKYLEEVSQEPQEATTIPLHLIGVLGAAGAIALLASRYKKTPGGTRARLVARAHRKQDTGTEQGA